VKVSVIVPAFNEEKLITGTLRSIKTAMQAFTELDWETELIVCNNNSTDRTGDLAEAEGAKVVFESINQISRARNTGAAAATGNWLIFVDADSCPSRELFADTARHIQTGRYIAGGTTVRLDKAPPIAHAVARGWNLVSRVMKWCAGSYIFCETAAFRQVGGFSLELFASEEIDLSNRLKALAKKTGRKMIILRNTPLVTSARKISLYSRRTHLRLFIKAILRPSATLRNRDECLLWYDGKR
jgi:glycosyltransferase involved in cell wall biosynthesis